MFIEVEVSNEACMLRVCEYLKKTLTVYNPSLHLHKLLETQNTKDYHQIRKDRSVYVWMFIILLWTQKNHHFNQTASATKTILLKDHKNTTSVS